MRILSLLTLLVATGCNRDEEPAPVAADGPTWYGDVAPIVMARCAGCHQDGAVGPMRLDNYDDAKTWSSAMAAATAARTMPPQPAVGGGACGDLVDDLWLTEAEIDTFARWMAAGAPEGAVAPLDPPAERPRLVDGLDLVLPEHMPVAWGDDFAKYDEYRCFRIDPGLTGPGFLTGYDVIPGYDAVVHHVIAMPVDPAASSWFGDGSTNGDLMDAYEASDEVTGWPCFGAAGDGVAFEGVPVVWAPGQGVVRYPEGTGIPLDPGHDMVVQVHYNLVDPDTVGHSDQTTVRLEVTDDANLREAGMLLPDPLLESLFGEQPVVLEGGLESVPFTWEMSAEDLLAWYGEVDLATVGHVDLYGIMPHMHAAGRQETLTVIHADDTETCGIRVDDWDFGWQRLYFHEEPIRLVPGDRVRVTCTYDSRDAPEGILPGWGTENEMCLAAMYFAMP